MTTPKTPQTTLTLTCPRCLGIGRTHEDRDGEPCPTCDGTGNATLTVSTNAALNYLLGRVIVLEKAASDGNPYTYQAYYDGLSNLGENE